MRAIAGRLEVRSSAGSEPGSGFASAFGIFLTVEVGLDLGKETADCLGGGDGSPERVWLAESKDVLRRIWETYKICGAVRAQQLHAGSGKIRF